MKIRIKYGHNFIIKSNNFIVMYSRVNNSVAVTSHYICRNLTFETQTLNLFTLKLKFLVTTLLKRIFHCSVKLLKNIQEQQLTFINLILC
jgi:hypothetical protein